MEASLLTSAAVKPASVRTSAAAPMPQANAPFVGLPLAFILTGLLALFSGIGCFVMWPALLATYHYSPHIVALTHWLVLGWMCTVVMGVVYQLVPVALETKLWSERLARWHFFIHVAGVAGMIWMFWIWNLKHVGHFGALFAFGVGLFVYNVARTLRRVPKWNVTATAVTAALVWISLAAAAGLCIAISKCSYSTGTESASGNVLGGIFHVMQSVKVFVGQFEVISAMHAHAHLGAVGCFMMLIVGVSYKLIPMFTLSEVQSRGRAACSVVLLNLGLAGSFVAILVRSPWKLAFAFVVVAALALYGWELIAILRARKRRPLDWGIKYFLTAVALLLPVSALAVLLSWPGRASNPILGQLENAYGFLGLIGVVTFAVIGMLYKIIPFLVWFACYSGRIGRDRVPALAELYSVKLQAAGYWTWLAGLAIAGPSMVFSSEPGVRAGCALLALGAATLLVNVGLMLTHFFRPRIEPLRVQPFISPKPA